LDSYTFSFNFDGITYTAACHPKPGEEGKVYFMIYLPDELAAIYGSPIRITRTREGVDSYPSSIPLGQEDGPRLIASLYTGFSTFGQKTGL
jgi:hypothetical protein